MPLEYQCVRCVECHAFQAKQATKSKTWACRLCGQKQTLLRVHAISHSAKDIRLHVQQLNMARATAAAAQEEVTLSAWEQQQQDVQDQQQLQEQVEWDAGCEAGEAPWQQEQGDARPAWGKQRDTSEAMQQKQLHRYQPYVNAGLRSARHMYTAATQGTQHDVQHWCDHGSAAEQARNTTSVYTTHNAGQQQAPAQRTTAFWQHGDGAWRTAGHLSAEAIPAPHPAGKQHQWQQDDGSTEQGTGTSVSPWVHAAPQQQQQQRRDVLQPSGAHGQGAAWKDEGGALQVPLQAPRPMQHTSWQHVQQPQVPGLTEHKVPAPSTGSVGWLQPVQEQVQSHEQAQHQAGHVWSYYLGDGEQQQC